MKMTSRKRRKDQNSKLCHEDSDAKTLALRQRGQTNDNMYSSVNQRRNTLVWDIGPDVFTKRLYISW